MDKYDEAIAFLKSVEPGSYFDECAELMEQLLYETQKKPSGQLTKEEREWMRKSGEGARYYAKAKGLL
jgi:hypothetical protein